MLDPEGRATDGEVLDLLVDGELGGARRGAVLERLAAEPDGWRRCAMAFLEAQCFRGGLAGMGKASASGTGSTAGSIRRRPPRPGLRAVVALAAAAALAASFGLGRASTGWGPVPGGTGPSLAREVSRTPEGAASQLSGIRRTDLAGPAPGTSAVSLRLKGGGSDDALIQVPLVEIAPSDPAWALVESRLATEDVVERLARSGREVYRRRRWFPLDLGDGRRAVIPVDEVEAYPERPGTYQ